jgi:hypothetical protein
VPLAAVGIGCLGLVPTLGGPDRPLHWAMTAGMVGFGALLWTRHRLGKREGALRPVRRTDALRAARTVVIICGVIGLLMAGIVASRWHSGGSIAWLSVAMPLATLAWISTIGLRAQRLGNGQTEGATSSERPSRRPPGLEALASATARPSSPPADPQVSA